MSCVPNILVRRMKMSWHGNISASLDPARGIHQSQFASNAVEQTVEWKVIGNAMTVMWRHSSATFKLLIVLVSNSFVFMEKYSLLRKLNIRLGFTGSRTL